MLRNLRDALTCTLLLILILGCASARWWIKNVADKIDAILDHANSATYNASDLTWQTDAMLYDSRPILHQSLIHADQAAGETSRTMQHIAHATQDIAEEQQQEAAAALEVTGKVGQTVDTLNEQIESVGGQARETLGVAEVDERSFQHVLDDLDRQINTPYIEGTFKNVQGITDSWNRLSQYAANEIVPKPYTGKHKVLHSVGRGFYTGVRIIAPFAESAFYGSNIKR